MELLMVVQLRMLLVMARGRRRARAGSITIGIEGCVYGVDVV